MFDVWYGELNIGTALVAGAIVLVLPLQLLLCFKVRRLWVRLLPVGIFLALGLIFVCLAAGAAGWDGLGYAIFAAYAGMLTLVSGLGWGVWGLVKLIKKRGRLG